MSNFINPKALFSKTFAFSVNNVDKIKFHHSLVCLTSHSDWTFCIVSNRLDLQESESTCLILEEKMNLKRNQTNEYPFTILDEQTSRWAKMLLKLGHVIIKEQEHL